MAKIEFPFRIVKTNFAQFEQLVLKLALKNGWVYTIRQNENTVFVEGSEGLIATIRYSISIKYGI